jgi:sulfatase modifying factor 1
MKRILVVLCVFSVFSISLLSCSDDNGTEPEKKPVIDLTAYGLVGVPATSGFSMGYTGVGLPTPIHTVSLDSFQIAKHEVAYALWVEVRTWGTAHGYTFANPGQQGSHAATSTAQHPVTKVSWQDCIAWCNAASEKEGLGPVYYNAGLTHTSANVYRNSSTGGAIGDSDVVWSSTGFRLLTEAEWEYAARYIDGATLVPGDQHCGYNIDPVVGNCAWYSVNSGDSTHAVGEKQANSLGLKDMSGNAWEWCWDWYGEYTSDAQDNPHGPSSGTRRVLRSGSFHYFANDCRSAVRAYEDPSPAEVNRDDGFRIGRTVL